MNRISILFGSFLVVIVFPFFLLDGDVDATNYGCDNEGLTRLQVTLCFKSKLQQLEKEKADLQAQLVKANEAIENEAYSCDANMRNRDGFS